MGPARCASGGNAGMPKPTPEQLAIALQEAEHLRLSGTDDKYVGHSLLSLHLRVQVLENVLERTRHFLHAGYAGAEHAALVRAIEQAERQALEGGDDEERIHPW